MQKENKTPFVSAIIVAAGSSTRMGGISKQFLELCGCPVLIHTLRAFQLSNSVQEIIVAAKKQDIENIQSLINQYRIEKCRKIVAGGATRQESVACGLKNISEDAAFVAIHDGARPLITPQDIDKMVHCAFNCDACTIGMPVIDTIKKTDTHRYIIETPDRSVLYAVQTPQVFEVSLYRAAMEKACREGKDFTDDCQLLEYIGHPVAIISGRRDNIKITTPEDIAVAKALLEFRERGMEQ